MAGKTCSECGKAVPDDAPSGHCPQCLIGLAFGSLPEPANCTPCGYGDYELMEVIGRGGMGVVYRARQKSLKRLVALKMLTPHSAAFPDIVERLRFEAEAAASLNHPHIVTIHDVGEHNEHPFFTMELIEGTGMDKLIGPQGFRFSTAPPLVEKRHGPQAVVAFILAKIARAVDYAHKHGVLHRDLKPANILIDSKGEPHLVDFGLAKVLDRERALRTESGLIMGTIAFMSPEQAGAETKHVSTAADIYSLGAILYAMLTGKPPFRGETPFATLEQVINTEPKHPSRLNAGVDHDLATICLKCLEKDPRRRYSSAEALAEDLEHWLRHEPIEARPVRYLGRAWRWCQREPKLAALTAGLVLLLAATSVLGLALYRRAEREREKLLKTFVTRFQKPWDETHRVRIDTQELEVLANSRWALDGTEELVVLGVHMPFSDPLKFCSPFVELLNWLQSSQPKLASTRVRFELQVYSRYEDAVEGLRKGEVNLMRMDPATYVALRESAPAPPIKPIAKELLNGQELSRGVFFARAASGIKRVEDAKSFAFGNTHFAMANYLPNAELAQLGLHGAQLRTTNLSTTAAVIAAVRRGDFDVGSAELNKVALFTNLPTADKLVMLSPYFRSLNSLWVVSSKLQDATISVIQERLVSLKNPDMLKPLDRALTGFRPAHPADYDELKKQMDKARLFDERHPLTKDVFDRGAAP